ncbi:MerR family transcriptional regulator [Streptomyces sp. NPDC059491]|uniref:MerR family transcriptional regulator n=1 Tax=Streptomyces sp. NPDC059491 TaxID=3346850 RepID=UPI0036BB820B
MAETTLGITTGAVARRLGVSPTTVRSWEQRYGISPAVRAEGRHRRWSPADVAMLEEMCRLTASGVPPAEAAHAAQLVRSEWAPVDAGTPDVPPVGPPADRAAPREDRGGSRRAGPGGGLPLGDVRQECRGLARAAVRLDGPAMEVLLREVLARYGLVTSWEEVMAPALLAVGRKWESTGDGYVEVEHLLSWHVSTALRRTVVASAAAGTAAPVVLACVPAEQHTLPLEALAAGLAERGLPVRMFGAAVPPEALDAAVRRMGPSAVVLWSQTGSTADPSLAGQVASTAFGMRGARTAPLVLLAGPGWRGAPATPDTIRITSLREALDAVSTRYEVISAGYGEQAGPARDGS